MTQSEWKRPQDIDPVHKRSKSDGKAAGDLAAKMTALQIDQLFINKSALTPVQQWIEALRAL